MTDAADIIDETIFEQLLSMDEDDDDREFSRGLVENYFEQAATSFEKMDKAYNDKDLTTLSQLGHFLKGSSAALGLKKLKASCEEIQHVGALKDGKETLSQDEALKKIKDLLSQTKEEYKEAEAYLRKFFEMDEEDGSSTEPSPKK